jgi:two-component system, OmpR family, phosphate regulon response regulator PhoB
MMNILVADDAPSVRKLLRLILEPAHTVIEAEDGGDAIRQLQAHRPDVAILDVTMPVKTGLDVCRQLRSDPDLADTGVIVITANGVQTDRSMAMAAGADQFLTKPFSPVSIMRVVEEVFAARRTTGA